MTLVTSGYGGDSGIYRRLQELVEAEPFAPFYISMSDGKDHKVLKAGDLFFGESGLPMLKKSKGRVATLNPDHILAITLGLKPPHYQTGD